MDMVFLFIAASSAGTHLVTLCRSTDHYRKWETVTHVESGSKRQHESARRASHGMLAAIIPFPLAHCNRESHK